MWELNTVDYARAALCAPSSSAGSTLEQTRQSLYRRGTQLLPVPWCMDTPVYIARGSRLFDRKNPTRRDEGTVSLGESNGIRGRVVFPGERNRNRGISGVPI